MVNFRNDTKSDIDIFINNRELIGNLCIGDTSSSFKFKKGLYIISLYESESKNLLFKWYIEIRMTDLQIICYQIDYKTFVSLQPL